jgi:hypothetical protein
MKRASVESVIITKTISKFDGRSGMTVYIIVNFGIFVMKPSFDFKKVTTFKQVNQRHKLEFVLNGFYSGGFSHSSSRCFLNSLRFFWRYR